MGQLATTLITLLSGLNGPQRIFLSLFTILCPALLFIRWPHPEVLSFAFVTLCAPVWTTRAACARHRLRGSGRRSESATPDAGRVVWNPGHPRSTEPRPSVSGYGCRKPGLRPILVLLCDLRTPSLLVSTGAAKLHNVSAWRVWELLFDLNIGLAPYIPITLALFLTIVGRDLTGPVASHMGGSGNRPHGGR